MLFRSRLTEWMAITSPWPDSDASVPEPKERLKWSWQERKQCLREPLKLKYFVPLMRRESSLEKTLVLGKAEGKRREGTAEEEMVREGHRCNEGESGETPGDGGGQGGLACCGPWATKNWI